MVVKFWRGGRRGVLKINSDGTVTEVRVPGFVCRYMPSRECRRRWLSPNWVRLDVPEVVGVGDRLLLWCFFFFVELR